MRGCLHKSDDIRVLGTLVPKFSLNTSTDGTFAAFSWYVLLTQNPNMGLPFARPTGEELS